MKRETNYFHMPCHPVVNHTESYKDLAREVVLKSIAEFVLIRQESKLIKNIKMGWCLSVYSSIIKQLQDRLASKSTY